MAAVGAEEADETGVEIAAVEEGSDRRGGFGGERPDTLVAWSWKICQTGEARGWRGQ